MIWNYNRMETLQMLQHGGVMDLDLISTVRQQQATLGFTQQPWVPDISTIPINPFEEDEGQGYDSRRAGQRDRSASQRRADGEEASKDLATETSALYSKLNLPRPESDPLPIVLDIPTSWRIHSPKGIEQPLKPPPVEEWCAPEFLALVERVERKEKDDGVIWDEISPEERFDVEQGELLAAQMAKLGMTTVEAEAAASLVELGGPSGKMTNVLSDFHIFTTFFHWIKSPSLIHYFLPLYTLQPILPKLWQGGRR